MPINAVLLPALSRLQSQPERYRSMFLRLDEAIALIGFFLTGLFLALARPLTLALLGGVWWPIPLWTGAIVLSGIAGLFVSYLVVPATSPVATNR